MTGPARSPIQADHFTVGTLYAALADEDSDTRIVVRTNDGQYLFIREVVVDAMREHHRVDNTVITLPGEWVVIIAEPKPPRRPPVRVGSVDFPAGVGRVGGAVTLNYPSAVYAVALLDVLEKLARGRYGAPPREPFGQFRSALNTAAAQLAAAGTCSDTSDGGAGPTLAGNQSVMSTREAAELLEITPAAVTYLVRRRLLEATKFGNQWAISATSVSAYRASRRRKDTA